MTTLPALPVNYFTNADRKNGEAKAAQDAMLAALSELYFSNNLAAFAALSLAADKLAYATGAGSFGLTDLTSLARTLLACGNAAAMRQALGLIIGSNVQAYDADTCISDVVKAYTAQHHPTQLALTSSGGALSLSCDTCAMAYHSLTENITVGALANKVNGKIVELVLVNVSGSAKTVSWNAEYLPCNGVSLPPKLDNGTWALVVVEVAGTTTPFVRNAQTYP